MKNRKSSRILLFFSVVAAMCFGIAHEVKALPIMVDVQLTGDFRTENPDFLIVDVSIVSNTTSNVAMWTVDINSPLHPDLKLDEFYFNLALPGGVTASLGNFSPNGTPGKQWASVGGTNAHGSGSADFDFGVGLSGSGTGATNEVNNSTNLTFDVTLTGGLWAESIITTALLSTGGGIPSPGAQMGAHLQSLEEIPEGVVTEDSGFASNTTPVPEPATLLLFGVGAAGLAGFRRKFKR